MPSFPNEASDRQHQNLGSCHRKRLLSPGLIALNGAKAVTDQPFVLFAVLRRLPISVRCLLLIAELMERS